MSQLPPKILVIDADVSVAAKISAPLSKMNVDLIMAHDLQTATYRFHKEFFRVILVDQSFAELDGLSLIQRFREHEVLDRRVAGFVLMGGQEPKAESFQLLRELGQIGFLRKPLAIGAFIQACIKAFQSYTQMSMVHKIRDDIFKKLANGLISAEVAINQVHDAKAALKDLFVPTMVQLLDQIDDLDAAEKAVNMFDPEEQQDLRVVSLRGALALKKGDFSSARGFLEKADTLAPKNIDRMKHMSHMYLELKEPQKAVEKQKALLSLHPEKEDLKFEYFADLERHGFDQEAMEFCREVSSSKDVVRHFNNKGVLLSKNKDMDKAIAEYERALSYFPKSHVNYKIHFNLALAYARKGTTSALETAHTHALTARQLKPDYEKAIQLAEKIEKKLPGKSAS